MNTARLPVREEQQAATRRRILDACADLALRHGGLDDPELFTFARVAELAGVSERTVYRAFPTKRELSAAFLDEAVLTGGEALPTDLASISGFLRRVTQSWSERFPPTLDTTPPVAPGTTTGAGEEEDTGRATRDHAVLAMVEALPPDGRTEAQRRAVAGVLRHLISLRSVAQTAARFQVTLADAGEAHAWAVDTLSQSLLDPGTEGEAHGTH